MAEKEITRREVIRFLGVEIPLVVVSTQILTRGAYGQTYTRKVARVAKEVILDLIDNPAELIVFAPVYSERGDTVGGRIEELPNRVAAVADPKGVDLHGATLYAINGKTFDARSQEAIDGAFARMREFVENGEPVIWDVGNKGKDFQYVIEFT